jgi:2,4-dienoyl-CoA reductase-like NADH-dependent reductase (Old Yellow Enzyme family)
MSLLFEPFTIQGMTLKNRLVRSATQENTASLGGVPTDDARRLYRRLARGGAGLIVTGHAYVNRAGQAALLQNGAHTDAAVAAWRPIIEAVHEHGARIAMQIAHGGRQAQSHSLGRRALAPSAVPNFVEFSWPRSMTEGEIEQTVQDFGAAAGRVKAAGFDAVQIHAAHGYLIAGFLSPLTNRRRDGWGGDPERRFRFLAEVYRAVRREVGPTFPVLCKLNLKDFFFGGLSPRESFLAAHRLAEMGLDALEISGGIYETGLHTTRGDPFMPLAREQKNPLKRLLLEVALRLEAPRTGFEEAYFLPYAVELKASLPIPLILVGGIRRPEVAEAILEAGHADLISMSRPLIREPGLPNRWLAGNREPAQCVSCNQCLRAPMLGGRLQCYWKGTKPA